MEDPPPPPPLPPRRRFAPLCSRLNGRLDINWNAAEETTPSRLDQQKIFNESRPEFGARWEKKKEERERKREREKEVDSLEEREKVRRRRGGGRARQGNLWHLVTARHKKEEGQEGRGGLALRGRVQLKRHLAKETFIWMVFITSRTY